MSQFQGKETTEIPNSIYTDILKEVKKQNIKDLTLLTPIKMRDILRKLRLYKYYEHIPYITYKINGVQPPVMSRKIEERIRNMFKEIQEPFTKHCPKNRKNFLNYNYVLHKFCELLELNEFRDCFPLLKSREKLMEQDKIWEKICNDLGWEFVESI